jgi:predicted nucleic acid-binding protein
MITLDTSAIIALLDRHDRDHHVVTSILRAEAAPYLIPAPVLGEVGYFIESRLGHRVLAAFLDDLSSGAFTLDCGEDDLGRVAELTSRYADLPLGLVDAAVIACAERNLHRTLTLDQRDFGVVAREVPLTLLPDQLTA